jgi:hypothetical protein
LKVLSPISSEERQSLLGLFEAAKHEIIRQLNPGADIKEVEKKELKRTVFPKAGLDKYALPSALHARQRAGKRERPEDKDS